MRAAALLCCVVLGVYAAPCQGAASAAPEPLPAPAAPAAPAPGATPARSPRSFPIAPPSAPEASGTAATDQASGHAAGAAPAGDTQSLPPIHYSKRNHRLISVAFRDSPIQDVFQMLAQEQRINILLRKDVTGKVSVSLYDVTVPQAIQAIAEAGGYGVEKLRPNEFMVMSRKEAELELAHGETTVHTYKVEYSDVKTVAGILRKHLSRWGKITALPERHMLVVEDLPSFQARVKNILHQIDVEPRQIMIEAKILEISLNSADSFGIDWSQVFGSGSEGKLGTQGLSTPSSPGFFFSVVNKNLNIFLNALASEGRVHTLSTPKLLTLENREASVVIGERIGYKVTTTINLVTTESVQFLDTGVILKVVPSVDRQGLIRLKIHPEVSSGIINDGVPSKKSTEVTTQLLARNGQTILIGGLIKHTIQKSRNKVPGIGDLPVVGRLFSNEQESMQSSETVVLITPHLIRRSGPSAAAAAVMPRRVKHLQKELFDKKAKELEKRTGGPELLFGDNAKELDKRAGSAESSDEKAKKKPHKQELFNEYNGDYNY